MKVALTTKYYRLKYILLLVVPLILSAFIHIWNPIGFPYFVGDEGHYIRRSLLVLGQSDLQEGARYDHPYFGQLFLAGIFKIIGYPDSIDPILGDVYSTEMLYAIPRIIMGLLAVLDTFLIFKICERLYSRNTNIAFISSILFAVMPITWLTRRVYLDSIQLPLILMSILFAVCYCGIRRADDNNVKRSKLSMYNLVDKRTLMIILSGVTLGLAIFTKIPAFIMIPVIIYLILRTDKKYQTLGIWFIPVILIPAIWPVYAISAGEYDNWYNGVFSQAEREGSGIGSIEILFKIDPVLISIGIIGFFVAILIKKDLFLLLWLVPFLVFHTVVPWTQHFHWIQVLPAFCIAGAVFIDVLSSMFAKKPSARTTLDDYYIQKGISTTYNKGVTRVRKLINYMLPKYKNGPSNTTIMAIVVGVITIFGLFSSTMLITTNVNSSFFEMVTFISQALPEYVEKSDNDEGDDSKGLCIWCTTPTNSYPRGEEPEAEEINEANKVTMIGNHWIFGTFWIPKYVYHKDHDFKGFFTNGTVGTEKVLIVADRRLLDAISSGQPEEHLRELRNLYENSATVATFKENRSEFNDDIYPYQSMSENRGIGQIEVRKNF